MAKKKRHSAGGKKKHSAKRAGGKMPLEVRQHFAYLTEQKYLDNKRKGIRPIRLKRR
jgi:hypothetical protein